VKNEHNACDFDTMDGISKHLTTTAHSHSLKMDRSFDWPQLNPAVSFLDKVKWTTLCCTVSWCRPFVLPCRSVSVWSGKSQVLFFVDSKSLGCVCLITCRALYAAKWGICAL